MIVSLNHADGATLVTVVGGDGMSSQSVAWCTGGRRRSIVDASPLDFHATRMLVWAFACQQVENYFLGFRVIVQ